MTKIEKSMAIFVAGITAQIVNELQKDNYIDDEIRNSNINLHPYIDYYKGYGLCLVFKINVEPTPYNTYSSSHTRINEDETISYKPTESNLKKAYNAISFFKDIDNPIDILEFSDNHLKTKLIKSLYKNKEGKENARN